MGWLSDLLWLLPALWPAVGFFWAGCPCCPSCTNATAFHQCICPPGTIKNATTIQVDVSGTSNGDDPANVCYCESCASVDGTYLLGDWGTCDSVNCSYFLNRSGGYGPAPGCVSVLISASYNATADRLRVKITMTGDPDTMFSPCSDSSKKTSADYDLITPDCSLTYAIARTSAFDDGLVCRTPASVTATIVPA